MPKSEKVPPEKLRMQEAASRRLQRGMPANFTGRRRENKLNIKAGPAGVGGKQSLTKRYFSA